MIKIGILDNRTAFRPGETLEGAVIWELEKPPAIAELRLLWFTRGKGTEDSEVVSTVTFAAPQAGDTRDFRIAVPAAPYSFDGRLISLIWALELVLGDEFERTEIVIAPEARQIQLPRIEQPAKKRVAGFSTGQ